ncbi:hypothetical protein ABZ615_00780 [Streptomyces sp. NPDC007325]|uniref:hypothetical protein n=1 Tax=Streptomyces sp. NPDC007325 TaxID=3154588 RepID=UPI0033CC19CF
MNKTRQVFSLAALLLTATVLPVLPAHAAPSTDASAFCPRGDVGSLVGSRVTGRGDGHTDVVTPDGEAVRLVGNVRTAEEGDMLTMDYDASRLTLIHRNHVVVRADCS